VDELGDYNETAKLQETFDIIAARIEPILPESAQSAFHEWRELSYSIVAETHRGNPTVDIWAQWNRSFELLADECREAGISLIP
jgi:hypothetical protein